MPTVAAPTGGASTTAPTSAATPTAVPTLEITPEPVATCPAAPSPAELIFQTGPGTELIPLDGEPLPTPEVVDAASVPIVATVLGGVEHVATVSLDEGPVDGIEITEATADFLPFDTATTLPVKPTIDGGAVAIVLPDSTLSGQLRISVSWSGTCGTGDGSGSLALALVKSAVAAGCPATSDRLLAETAKLDGLQLHAGTLAIPLILTGWSGRWIAGVGASDIPQFAGWDQSRAVTAAPGALVVISETVDALSMVGIQVSIYRRADVLAFLAPDSTGELDTLAFIHRNPGPKGRASIPAPLEQGRYVVEVVGTWLTPCLGLETYSPFSLVVN
ncbi:MAG: hypothetical protein ABI620_04060 [Chloroflexota bacterium]